jgi:hypothetical protein
MSNKFDNSEIDTTISQIQNEFYSQSGKNMFFKKQQKYDCAAQVGAQIPLELLLRRTCWVLPDEINTVYIDYPIMKTYAVPELFDAIVEHIMNVCDYVKHRTGKITVALNFDGFTVSAAERYRDIISKFSEKCLERNTQYALILQELRVLNAPAAIEHIRAIVKTLILSDIHSRIRPFNKRDSAEQMRQIESYLV